MLDPLIVAALVELLYQIAVVVFPQLPISRELISAIVIALLGLFAFRAGVRPLVHYFAPKAQENGLISKSE